MKLPLILSLLGVGALGTAGVIVVSLGYAPGLSKKLGIGGPKDLGVTYTADDLATAQDKIEESAGAQSFTDAELTALLNSCTHSACIVNDLQVRTNIDGSFELSGVIERDRIAGFLTSVAPADQETANVMAALQALPKEPAFYAKAKVTALNDVVSIELNSATVASLPIPASVLTDVNRELTTSANSHLAAMPGIQIRAITVDDTGVTINADLEALPL